MVFSFTHPVFLAGLAALGAVVLLHFFPGRRFRRREFTALHFISTARERDRRKMRLRDLILLALRCAVVALITAGFAAPVLTRSLPKTNAGVVHYLAIDDTLSTTLRHTDGGTVFNKIRARALDFLQNTEAGARFRVYLFSAGPVGGLTDAAAAAQMLAALSPGGALRDLSSLTDDLAALRAQKMAVRLVMISDFAENVTETLANLPGHLGFDTVRVQAAVPDARIDNAAVTHARVQAGQPGSCVCRAVVHNRGTTPQRRNVTLLVSGRPTGKTTVELEPQEEKFVEFWVEDPGQNLALEVRLEGRDMLEGDDCYRLGVSPDAPGTQRILLVTRSRQEGLLFAAAMESLKLCPDTSRTLLTRCAAEAFHGRLLRDQDAAVFAGMSRQAAAHSEAIADFVRAGGQAYFFMTASGNEKLPQDASRLLGVEFLSGEPSRKAARLGASEMAGHIGHYEFSAPVFHSCYTVRPTRGTQVLWRFDNEQTFIAAKTLGRGQTYFVNTSLDASMSNLSTAPMWPMFCRTLLDLEDTPRIYAYPANELFRMDGIPDAQSLREPGWLRPDADGPWIGINPDPRETMLNLADARTAENEVLRLLAGASVPSGAQTAGIQSHTRQLWKACFTAALAVLLIEAFLARRFSGR